MAVLAIERGVRALPSDQSVRYTSLTILSVCLSYWACGGSNESSQGASAGTTQVASDSSVHSSGNATNRTDTDPRSLPDGGQSNLASNSGGASYTQPSPSGGNHSSSTAMSSGRGGTTSSLGGVAESSMGGQIASSGVTSTWGAAGNWGQGGTNSNVGGSVATTVLVGVAACDAMCERIVSRNCSSDPETVQECHTPCNSAMSDAKCGSAYSALASCRASVTDPLGWACKVSNLRTNAWTIITVSHADLVATTCNVQAKAYADCTATCSDWTKNQDETDFDCGGKVCATRCADAQACLLGSDCANQVCAGEPRVCQAPTCTDAVRNGFETDADCGGRCSRYGLGVGGSIGFAEPANPGGCPAGKGCKVPNDCISRKCVNNLCQGGVSCTSHADCSAYVAGKCEKYTGIALGACIGCDDGRMTGDESDVDCGGADCAPCQAGKRCSEARDCISGVCNRFVCAASP